MTTDRYANAIRRFDALNAEDPNNEPTPDGAQPKELLYAQRLCAWLDKLAPQASEALRLAARCQHVQRWKLPRNAYPMTKDGYYEWRNAAMKMHTEIAEKVLWEAGYDDATVTRVQSLMRKERLKKDPESQTLEDAVCLTFMEHYFEEFAAKHDDAKVIDIVQKTWRKLSPQAQQAALGLKLPAHPATLVQKALAG